jgi:hypothetical protein
MAKRKKRVVSKNDTLNHLELQIGVAQHCASLKAVIRFLEAGQREAAIARLDQAVHALHALVRGQCAGQTMKCPACGSEQDVVAWVDEGTCDACGEALEVPKNTTEDE